MNGITAQDLGEFATKLNFNRAALEKVYRLIDILKFINSDNILKDMLALKGGTALNLLYFDLPRLSVDVDLDFSKKDLSRKELLPYKKNIQERLNRHMGAKGFKLNEKMSRTSFSLESYTYNYINSSKNIDNIKIEINYSMRTHIIKNEYKNILPLPGITSTSVNTVSMYDLFASKFAALLFRNEIRDLYDVNNILQNNLFQFCDHRFLKKCVLFYSSISQPECPLSLNIDNVKNFTSHDIKTSLLPVIKRGEFVDLEKMKNTVFLSFNKILELTNNEKKYLSLFANKKFDPSLLFEDVNITQRLNKHPMVIWKMKNRDINYDR